MSEVKAAAQSSVGFSVRDKHTQRRRVTGNTRGATLELSHHRHPDAAAAAAAAQFPGEEPAGPVTERKLTEK